jgi:hypothetical protein
MTVKEELQQAGAHLQEAVEQSKVALQQLVDAAEQALQELEDKVKAATIGDAIAAGKAALAKLNDD